jgi:hypothetical protein
MKEATEVMKEATEVMKESNSSYERKQQKL